ncbi:MAG: DUF4012 domain-containing protein [Actinobacteria bacterium]|uniref:Unannotated protein n=1 Tax=freshwater metagenome TaxID=449393 RepID=A0A6J6Q5B5_9ZZZZ|nr:DUF4012 domain-containing protein [Actinomycetota bacterium]
MSRPRPFVLLGLAFVVLAGGFVLWLQIGLMSSLVSVALGARNFQTGLTGAVDQLTAGDYEAALANFDEVQSAADLVRASTGGPQVQLVGSIPGFATAVDNWRVLAVAASDITTSTGELLSIFGDLSGKSGEVKIFSDGAIDIELLKQLPPRVAAVNTSINDSVAQLKLVNTSGPAAGFLATVQAKALKEAKPVQRAVSALVDLAPLLPDALGANTPKRYLIAIGNQAEMRASGGAPLTLVLVEFDDGRISIPIKGQTSTQLYPPLNAPVQWWGPAGNPFFPTNPRNAPMVVANTHPSLLYSAREMSGAWIGGDYPEVDGVITLDLSSIAAVLNAIGPIASPTYGEVTGDRLGQLLLVEAYEKFGVAEFTARQEANQQLLDELLSRLLSGEDLVSVAKAIASTAPGRHFQVWMRDTRFENFILESGAGGSVRDPGVGDWSAVYTQNGNQSKVDVFQQRNVLVSAKINEDGSARVTQLMTVTNATPPERPEGPPERIGYETSWLKAAYLLYVPNAATNYSSYYPQGFTVRSFKDHQQYGRGFADDGFGQKLVRVVGWTAPGAKAEVSVSYDLPAGTFTAPDGSLVYTLQAEPQSIWNDATLTVRVTPPTGWRAVDDLGMMIDADGVAELSAVQSGQVSVAIAMKPAS